MTYYTEEQAMKKYCLFQSGCCRASSCMGWQWEQVVDKVIPKPFPYPTKYIYIYIRILKEVTVEQQEVIEEMKNPRKLFECDDVVVIIGDEVIGELKEFDLFIDRKAGPIY